MFQPTHIPKYSDNEWTNGKKTYELVKFFILKYSIGRTRVVLGYVLGKFNSPERAEYAFFFENSFFL